MYPHFSLSVTTKHQPIPETPGPDSVVGSSPTLCPGSSAGPNVGLSPASRADSGPGSGPRFSPGSSPGSDGSFYSGRRQCSETFGASACERSSENSLEASVISGFMGSVDPQAHTAVILDVAPMF